MKTNWVFILILTVSFNCWSQVNVKRTVALVLPQDPSAPLISAETSTRLQPKTVAEGESAQSVVSKIADNTLAFLWDTSSLKNTSVGRAAEKVEKNLKTEVEFQDSAPGSVNHKITFKVLAMQALAKLEYKGWLNAAVNYDARSAKTEAEVTEAISKQQDFVVSHAFTPSENLSQVAWRWNW